MLSLVKLITVMLLFWGFPQILRASETLPGITAYSSTTFAVTLGDKINLEVQLPDGQDRLSVQWLSREKVLCSGLQCEVDTTGWVIGKHTLVLRVKNSFGSVFIPYTIYVRDTAGQAGGQITPQLIDAKEGLADLAVDDFYVLARRGLGSIDRKECITMVDTLPKQLTWSETLKAHGRSLVHFGRQRVDEHFLFSGSIARLRTSADHTRIIDLIDGTLRSRQIGADPAKFVVTVAPYGQVSGDQDADFVVRRTGDGKATTISISVLRGIVRLLLPKGKLRDEQKAGAEDFKELLLPQGARVNFSVDQPEALSMTPLRNKEVSAILGRTTPWLLHPTATQRGENVLIRPHRFIIDSESDGRVRSSIEQLLQRNDAVLALEKLSFALAQGKTIDRQAYLIGAALHGLGLHKEASSYLDEAHKLDPENIETCLLNAKVHVYLRNDKKAVELYERCGSDNLSEAKDWMYDWAIASYRLAEIEKARVLFQQVYEAAEAEALREDAKTYLKDLKENRPWRAFGQVSYFSDSNILGVGETSGSTLKDLPLAAKGYVGIGDIAGLWRIGTDGYLGFGYRGELEQYSDATLKDLTRSDQEIYFPFRFGLDDDTGHLAVSLSSKFFGRTIALGEERGLDGYGTEAELRFHDVPINPFFGWHLAKYVDPLPDRDDKLDPLSREVATPSDRSRIIQAVYAGGCVVCKYIYNLELAYRYHQERFQDSLSRDESFKRYGFESKQRFTLSDSTELKLNANYERELFLDNSLSRKDIVLRCGFLVTQNLYGPLQINGGADYTRRESNVDLHQFRKTRFSLGLALVW